MAGAPERRGSTGRFRRKNHTARTPSVYFRPRHRPRADPGSSSPGRAPDRCRRCVGSGTAPPGRRAQTGGGGPPPQSGHRCSPPPGWAARPGAGCAPGCGPRRGSTGRVGQQIVHRPSQQAGIAPEDEAGGQGQGEVHLPLIQQLPVLLQLFLHKPGEVQLFLPQTRSPIPSGRW